MEPLYLFRVNLFFLNVLGLGSQSAVGERCYNFLPPTESHGRALATHFRQGAGKITTKCKFLWLDKLSFKLTSITCVVQGKTQTVIQKLCVFFFFTPALYAATLFCGEVPEMFLGRANFNNFPLTGKGVDCNWVFHFWVKCSFKIIKAPFQWGAPDNLSEDPVGSLHHILGTTWSLWYILSCF